MPERDAHDTDPAAGSSGPPATPRVSGEQLASVGAAVETPFPESSTRPSLTVEPPAVSEPSDTLLSAGKPADRLEVLLEDHLATVDERLRQVDAQLHELDARLGALELRKPTSAPEPRQKPWLWIAFLIGLVVVFQLLRRVR